MRMPLLRRLVKQKFSDKADNVNYLSGVVGDGAGHIETGTANLLYCRVGDQVVKAWGANTPHVYGLSVYLCKSSRYPGDLEIVGNNMRSVIGGSDHANVAHHGASHGWLQNDPAFVHLRQFLPLWIGPTGNPDTPYSVRIGRGLVWTGTALVEVASQTVDLTDHLPYGDSNDNRYVRYVLISVSTAGAVVATDGTAVLEADFGLDDIPAAPTGTLLVLGAVRLYSDQVQIVETREQTDIIDLRYPYRHTHLGSEVGGHDAVTVVDGATVDLALTGQQLTAEVIPGAIKLDDLGAPDDNTDLDASTTRHGLMMKFPGGAAKYLREDGTWVIPAASITLEEIDGSPSIAGVSKIKVTNGTLTDDGGGTATIDFGSAATDGAAIHDNTASEIHAITEKTTLADNDEFIIEDSADGYAKKRARVKSIVSKPIPKTITQLMAWYAADSLDLSDGAAVTMWPDLSGNGFSLYNLGTRVPTFQTGEVNSLPAVYFNNAFLKLSEGRIVVPSASWLMVIKFITNANHAVLLSDTGNHFGYLQYADTWYVGNGVAESHAQNLTAFELKSVIYTAPSTVHRWTNATDHGAQSVTGNLGWSGIGFSSYVQNFEVAEFMFFSKALSSADHTTLRNYINSKYALWT